MKNDRKISLCITHFNRADMIFKSFENVLDDNRISEIVIVDDCSSDEQYNKLLEGSKISDKIRVIRNTTNIGCYRNKRKAIGHALNEWAIIFDSDNVMDKSYIDNLYNFGWWNPSNVYAPSEATPFDYNHFSGIIVTHKNASKLSVGLRFETMLNTMNYFVNRDEYIEVWDADAKPFAIDSIYQNLRWISSGRNFFVVPGLKYVHNVHKGSLYLSEGHLTQSLHKVIMNKFKAMK